ncbi:MAG: Na+/H+ antiporter subunit E [Planctomycetes bacterium]|nr:Na+/H+ antiporter subunit E [Planctomycetota bacterium]MCB9826252.1 Na+/H+ antiporter subunit E [Planctomycetota bacterium]MCB9828970.1 Na+/H+ antiporter subunit E [Planctomycetota bacterium]MCB9901825.1 Na+/H+ antiporter subunit E [Planctomycetota bacterium]
MSFLLTWLVMGTFWFLLSGFTDPIHLGYGAVSTTIVAALSHKHLTQGGAIGLGIARAFRTAAYLPWLLWQILLANLDVILCVLGLRRIEPRVLRIRSGMHSTFGLVALANSITLTPGTVTVDVEGDDLIIHALTVGAAQGVEDRVIEKRLLPVEGSAPAAPAATPTPATPTPAAPSPATPPSDAPGASS